MRVGVEKKREEVYEELFGIYESYEKVQNLLMEILYCYYPVLTPTIDTTCSPADSWTTGTGRCSRRVFAHESQRIEIRMFVKLNRFETFNKKGLLHGFDVPNYIVTG